MSLFAHERDVRPASEWVYPQQDQAAIAVAGIATIDGLPLAAMGRASRTPQWVIIMFRFRTTTSRPAIFVYVSLVYIFARALVAPSRMDERRIVT